MSYDQAVAFMERFPGPQRLYECVASSFGKLADARPGSPAGGYAGTATVIC